MCSLRERVAGPLCTVTSVWAAVGGPAGRAPAGAPEPEPRSRRPDEASGVAWLVGADATAVPGGDVGCGGTAFSERSLAGIGSSRTTSVVPPTSIVSPTDSVCGPLMRRPFTNDPLVDPRSSIAQKPLRSKLMRACEREISSSSASRPAPSAWRPIKSSSSSRIDMPTARPATTSSRAIAGPMA